MSYRKHLMTSDEPPSELYKATELGTNLASLGTDCISRQQAIDALNEVVKDHSITDFDAIASILDLPPAQPERIKGHWIDAVIPNDSGGLPVIVCDKCNTFFPLQFGDGHNFCPNCGADMRGEKDG